MDSIWHVPFDPGCVLFVPVGNDVRDVQSSIWYNSNCPQQSFMFHPGTISDLITLKDKDLLPKCQT